VPPAPQLRYDDRPSLYHLVSLLIMKRNRPAAGLIEAFDRVRQMSEEGITAEFSIADDVQPDPCLKVNCLIDSPILDALELGVAEQAGIVALAGLLQIVRAQKTSNRIAAESEHEYLQGNRDGRE